MDQLKAIRYFLKVGETSSFTEAAEYFGVPPSSLSRRVADLEAHLGATLLKRTTRLVKLTEIGEEYFSHSKNLVELLEQNDELVRSYQETPSGTLRISAFPGIGEGLLIPALNEMRQAYPEMLLDLELTDQVKDLGRDSIDLAIRGGYAPNERVVAVKLLENNFVPTATPAYLENHGTPKTPLEFKHHKAILYRTPMGPLRWLAEINEEWNDVTGEVVNISNSREWLLEMVLNDEGILMIPEWSAAPYLKSGKLVQIKTEPKVRIAQDPGLGIYLLYQKHRYAVPKIKVAVDYLTQYFKRHFA